MPPVELEFTGKDDGALKLIAKLEAQVEELRKEVERLSGKPLDIKTDPAEAELKQLRAELKKVERAYQRATERVDFEMVARETDKGTAASKRLAAANKNLVVRSKQLIRVVERLPPELRKTAVGLDQVEKQAGQAARAVDRFKKTASPSSFAKLTAAVGQLRTGLAAMVAVLGVRQLIRFGRALVDIAGRAVETKKKFDSLIPSLAAFTGSVELAGDVADRLAGIADRLQAPLADVIQPFLRISAALKETSLSLREQSDLFESALLTVRAFGLGTSETSRLITGFAQVAGKGTLQMEELRQQIGEVAFNALPALSKALGVSLPQLFADVAAGTVDAETALRGLASGLREANEAAGLAQLDTLRGDLGALARESEKAQLALADGLEPGLRALVQASTEFLAANRELIAGLGELGSTALDKLGGLVAFAEKVSLGLKSIGIEALEVGRILETVSFLPGAEGIAQALQAIGISIAGVEQQAKDAVDGATRHFRRLQKAGGETAEEILETFQKSFREQAEAAGLAAEDIEATEKELAARVGEIQDRASKGRVQVEEFVVQEFERFGEVRAENEEAVASTILDTVERGIKDRVALIATLVEETQAGAARRILAETAAAAANLALFKEIRDGANELSVQRIEATARSSGKIQELEEQLSQDILKVQEEFLQQLANPKVDRAELRQKTLDKIVELEVAASVRIIAEMERIAVASKKLRDARIADEEKVRAELEKTAQKLLEQLEKIREAAGATDEGSSAAGPLLDDLDAAVASAFDLVNVLDQLRADDPFSVLTAGVEALEAVLPPIVDGFGDFFTAGRDGTLAVAEGLGEDADAASSLDGLIADIKKRFDELSPAAQASTSTIIDGFEALQAAGGATEAEIRNVGRELAEALKEPVKPAEDLGQAIGDVGKDAEGIEEASAAAARLGGSLGDAGKAADGAEQQIVELADGTKAIVSAGGDLAETMENSAERVKELGDAAGDAAGTTEDLAAAADKLREPIVGDEEPGKIDDLGTAAAAAVAPVGQLAEPAERVAASASSLENSLPLITAALAEITPALQGLLKLLTDNPVDLEAVKIQLLAIAEPLNKIGVDLGLISKSVAALPDPLVKVADQAGPLFALVTTAAEADVFGKVADPVARLAATLPKIPQPLEKFSAALELLVEIREDVDQALQAITTGLEAVAADTILEPLADLEEKLAEVVKRIREAGDGTEAWSDATGKIIPVLGGASAAAQTLAKALEGDLVPALELTEKKTVEAGEAMKELQNFILDARAEIVGYGEDAKAAFELHVAGAEAAIEANSRLVASIQQLAEATAAISPP